MVRSTFAVFKLSVKMYVFYDNFTVCIIRLGHWVPILCYMGAAEMCFSVLPAKKPVRGHNMVRFTFAVFIKLCVKMYDFYDTCTVCVI